MKNIFLPFISLLLLFSCQSEPTQSGSPESVVRQWQDHMDKNEFGKAKELSTPETQVTITSIEALLSMDQEPIPIDTTEFIKLSCKEKEQDAVCYYSIKIEGEYLELDGEIVKMDGEIIADSFLLKKIKGEWLIDIPEEMTGDEEMEGMEELLDALMEDAIPQE